MRSKRQKEIINLLNRYLFIDFATAVSKPNSQRKDHLRMYVDRARGNWPSYKGFRSQIKNIMGVPLGLDPSNPMDLEAIERSVKIVSQKKDQPANLELARCMFSFVRSKPWKAYGDHPRNTLNFGVDRSVPMSVEHYVVEEDRGAFQFVYPRSKELSPDELNVCLSLIYYNHVAEDEDFGQFDVEILDLSRPNEIGPRGGVRSSKSRRPRIHRLAESDLLDRAYLNDAADSIYQYLIELAQEPES